MKPLVTSLVGVQPETTEDKTLKMCLFTPKVSKTMEPGAWRGSGLCQISEINMTKQDLNQKQTKETHKLTTLQKGLTERI